MERVSTLRARSTTFQYSYLTEKQDSYLTRNNRSQLSILDLFYDIIQSETIDRKRFVISPQKIELITSPVFHYIGIIIYHETHIYSYIYIVIHTPCSQSALRSISVNLFNSCFFIHVQKVKK